MLRALLPLLLGLAVLVGIDFYAFQAVRTAFQSAAPGTKRLVFGVFWALSIITIAIIIAAVFGNGRQWSTGIRNVAIAYVFTISIAKLFILPFLLVDDILRLGKYAVQNIGGGSGNNEGGITRLRFLSILGLIIAGIPAALSLDGILRGVYNYKVRNVAVKLPNLPQAFNGFKIIQLSDIHSGSLTNKEAVQEAIAKINSLEPDLILFTGDLVNSHRREMQEWKDIFSELKATHGVLSVKGNHDYEDYYDFGSPEAAMENRMQFNALHGQMGWDLLLDDARVIEKDGEQISIIGVENISATRFHSYGKLKDAYAKAKGSPVKILMSHDPSHWDMEVNKQYPDIDLTLSGHTHGAQMGVEAKWLKWSPSQYFYKQWAGLYSKENSQSPAGKQYLYVNRGFGFIGFPGRIGMPPEIALIELQKA